MKSGPWRLWSEAVNVLLVDDNEDIRTLMRRVLSMAGIEVSEAASGAEALAALRDQAPPDVVVLDVQMPVVDGWETLRSIRTDPDLRALPVVMCTVKGRPEDVDQGLQLGCTAYVAKPFDIEVLVDTVRQVASSGASGTAAPSRDPFGRR